MSAAKAKGTAAERDAVRYLQEYWPDAERRALAGAQDRGDIAGIPRTVGEVKAAVKQELPKWVRETWSEMQNAKADHCFLVVKRPRIPVARWDFWMPCYQLGLMEQRFGPSDGPEAWQWVRMDFRLGREVLQAVQFPFL